MYTSNASSRFAPSLAPLVLALASLSLPAPAAPPAARVWTEPLVIPTYPIGPPEPVPLFHTSRAYQRAAAPVYPYAMLDRLTGQRADRTYQAVYLENDYLKVCVLPELGGRLFSALDKTNQYDFIYRQHVIKPALVGMLGAWISGGIEWNVPHHHRATTFQPVASAVESLADGGKTVWVGELELRDRMRWMVGLTIRPGKAYLEVTGRVINRTPLAHSMLYFANIAVAANDRYQIIFPPATQFVTNHSKKEFSRWPISDNVYNNIDFRGGVDVSWWKNHPSPISMFAWGNQGDFVAGYDHGRRAGLVHVADRHVVPGRKFFTWGAGSAGKGWDEILTDTDGPYIELMAGAYSDNQPDYSWIHPFTTREFHEYLYPIREIGGVKQANREAAVNLELAGGRLRAGVLATSAVPAAEIVVERQGTVLLREQVALHPGKAWTRELPAPAGARETGLRIAVRAGKRDIISYTPPPNRRDPMPDPVTPPPPPSSIRTNEELYMHGLRLEQLRNPAYSPAPYYAEALRRDPGDARVRTLLGRAALQGGLYAEAKTHLEAAVARLSSGYTHPKDTEANYYLGLTLSALGRNEEAEDRLRQAAWNPAWSGPAYHELALLAGRQGNLELALEYARGAAVGGAQESRRLEAILLRRLGRLEAARKLIAALRAGDPLDRAAEVEAWRLSSGPEAARRLSRLREAWKTDAQSFFEAALDYARLGLWDDAAQVLSPFAGEKQPMVHYYLGYFAERAGRREEALRHYRQGKTQAPDYCFPFRLEEIAILRSASAADAADARAPYYLGNLLYDRQPEAAVQAWEQARVRDPQFAMVHRNLAWAYARAENNLPKAVASLEAAVSRDRRTPRFLVELDELYARENAPLARRLKALEDHRETVLADQEARKRLAIVLVAMGEYDRAIALLTGFRFHVWEGAGRSGIHNVWVDAHLERGHRHFAAGRYAEALADYSAALEYPPHLGTPRPQRGERLSETYYLVGLAREKLGQEAAAKQAFEEAVNHGPVNWMPRRPAATDQPEMYYYLGLAMEKLGRPHHAQIAEALVRAGEEQLSDPNTMDYFTPYGEHQAPETWRAQAHYAIALGHLIGGRVQQAQTAFEAVLRQNAAHLGARRQLSDTRRRAAQR